MIETRLLGRAIRTAAKQGHVDAMQVAYHLLPTHSLLEDCREEKAADTVRQIDVMHDGIYIDLNQALEDAAVADHTDAMKVLMNMGSVDVENALQKCALANAVKGMEMAISLGAISVNAALINAAKWNNMEAVKVALSAGADNYLRAAAFARSGGHDDLADFIIAHP